MNVLQRFARWVGGSPTTESPVSAPSIPTPTPLPVFELRSEKPYPRVFIPADVLAVLGASLFKQGDALIRLARVLNASEDPAIVNAVPEMFAINTEINLMNQVLKAVVAEMPKAQEASVLS